MANLTSKLKNRARREEQRENWSAAIELYSRALRASERNGAVDVSLYNRIGDIFLRLDDVDSAVGAYERAIVRYAEQELHTSAIALCNKVLRIQPSRISTYLRLGRLQLETGLIAEARVNYLRYATELITRGESDEAHAALEEYVVRTGDLNSALRFGGALVANDRSDEALSLFLRLRAQLEKLGRDASPLERPLAAIQGFDAGPTTASSAPSGEEVSTVAALDAEMTGALDGTSAPPNADPTSIVELESELEAAVGAEAGPEEPGFEPVEPGFEPVESGAEPVESGAEPVEPEAGPEESGFEPVEPEAGLVEPGAEPVEPGAGPERADRREDGGPSPIPLLASAPLATPEAPEHAADDDGLPRIPAEGVEGLESDPAVWPGQPEVGTEPAEVTGGDPDRLEGEAVPGRAGPAGPEEGEAEACQVAPAGREPAGPEPAELEAAEEVALATGAASAGAAGRKEEGVEPVERRPAALARERFEQEAEEDEEAWVEPCRGARLGSDADPDAPEMTVAEPEPAPGARGPARERIERPVRAGRSLRPAILTHPERPEREVLAPAARLAAELVDEAAEVVAEMAPEATPVAPVWTEEREGSEPAPFAVEEGPGQAGRPPAADVPELEPLLDGDGGLDAEPGSPAVEPSEAGVSESVVTGVSGPPSSRELEPAESTAGGEPEEVDSERGRRELEEGLTLLEAEEFDRALAALERAARNPVCFVEAHAAIQACRAALAAPGDIEAPGGAAAVEAEVEAEIASWTPEDQPPDETFRDWLSAAEYDVLKRAFEELERREELERALAVIQRMLELRPANAALHRVRIAHLAELGRDQLLPAAYLELGRALEDGEDFRAARAAYERAAELDPDRIDEVRELLRALERRLASIDPLLDPATAGAEREESGPERRQHGRAPEAGVPHGEVSLGPRQTSMDEHGPAGEGDGEVQVYRGVVQDLGFGEVPGVGEAWGMADPGAAEREGTVDFDVILAELKEQLADSSADEPDVSSRAEVGERLMEMGLLDDAIRELQTAIRSPDAPPRAFELLGRAFVEKGQPRVASRLLAEALSRFSGALDEERLLGVLYQLGVAYQEAELPAQALECYERIFSVDIDYRDVRARIAACVA